MQAERFKAIIEAYGSGPQRWPAGERAAALAYRDAHPREAEALLGDAAVLDRLLDRLDPPAAGVALTARIMASAPAARVNRLRLWWGGASLAGIGFAGALAGALAVAVLSPMPATDDGALYAATAFSDLSGDD